MARLKAKCSSCNAIVSLLFEDQKEYDDIQHLRKGEFFEHKCPVCESGQRLKL